MREDPNSAEAMAATIATPTSQPSKVNPAEAPLEEGAFAERYLVRTLLGAGGMGEVHLCKDERIGREVAIKVTRTGSGSGADETSRFVREARVQGQLEHPAIVPVYDLGRRPDGAVFFTMKRVRGRTLEQILDGLRAGNGEDGERYSRRRLLSAFVSACQAIHFAHTRGVLHRDIKPGNIMLGDFGEVYVLDWGLAKISGIPDEARPEERVTSGPDTGAGHTTSGAIMGTPGYMAPEQLRGEIDKLDARVDVYPLGAVLFEILTLRHLHPRATAAEAIASTLGGADTRCGVLAPERSVPPELEQVCARATSLDPAERFAGVGELHQAVERFLDGDRDLARRRELADGWARAAEDAATRAISSASTDDRSHALADAGRALALDPAHPGALRTMMQLLLAPPRALPPEVGREIEMSTARTIRVVAGAGGVAYLSWLAFLPLMLSLGVRNWAPVIVWVLAVLGMGLVGVLGARVTKADWRVFALGLLCSNVAIICTSRFFGSYVLVPGLAAVNTVGFLLHAHRGWRWVTVAAGTVTVLAPVALEALGVFASTTQFRDGALVITSAAAHFPETVTLVVLVVSMVSLVVMPALFVGRVRDALAKAEERLQLHSWHLRQLVPDQARGALEPHLEEVAPLFTCQWTGRPIGGVPRR